MVQKVNRCTSSKDETIIHAPVNYNSIIEALGGLIRADPGGPLKTA
jgi:hypothetical protein